MPARLGSGVAYHGNASRRSNRQAARRHTRITRQPAYQGRQRSYRRYHRQQVGPARNVGKAINRQVQHEQRVAAHRKRVVAKKARVAKQRRHRAKEMAEVRTTRERKQRGRLLELLLRGPAEDTSVFTTDELEGHKSLANYGVHADRLWRQVAHLYGRKGAKRPAIIPEGMEPGVAAYVYGSGRKGKRPVHVTPVAYRGTSKRGMGLGHRDTLLHEWAHTTQKNFRGPSWLVEGSANTKAADVARKLKRGKFMAKTPQYRRYTRKVRRRGLERALYR